MPKEAKLLLLFFDAFFHVVNTNFFCYLFPSCDVYFAFHLWGIEFVPSDNPFNFPAGDGCAIGFLIECLEFFLTKFHICLSECNNVCFFFFCYHPVSLVVWFSFLLFQCFKMFFIKPLQPFMECFSRNTKVRTGSGCVFVSKGMVENDPFQL